MLELGRVDFEVTLTLCRWEWGSCAPCYVPARFNSDGGSSFPRLLSPPLFQHHSFKDSTSLSKTQLSTILPPQDRTFARFRRMQSSHLGLTQSKCKEVTFLFPPKKQKLKKKIGFPGERNRKSSGICCKYSFVQYTSHIKLCSFAFHIFTPWEDRWGICHICRCADFGTAHGCAALHLTTTKIYLAGG